MAMDKLLAVARGDKPADLVLENAHIVNVFSGEIEQSSIAIAGDRIAGIGSAYDGLEVQDLDGAYVTPGLIDAHVHIESSLCVPAQFATALVPRGVTTAVVDPHELANVAGVAGVRYMIESCLNLPIDAIFMASSCVPATPIQDSGEALTADDLAALLLDGAVHGLAEVMNYHGVVVGDGELARKILAFNGRPIDGHAPGLTGKALNTYVAAGVGSDHECTTVEEASEKLSRGLYLLIREATNARNLHRLLPVITPQNSRRICFCTDDRIPNDLLGQGSIDYMVREAIDYGLDPVDVIRMVTLNAAEWFQLADRGAIAPGRLADLAIVDVLDDFRPKAVYKNGVRMAESGVMLRPTEPLLPQMPRGVRSSMNVAWDALEFRIPARGSRIRAIGSVADQLYTNENIVDAEIVDGFAVASPARDLLKMAVIERHQASGYTGLGFIQGIGLQAGAIAGTVAHDHHNLVVIGADDGSMMTAAKAVGEMDGGLVVVNGDDILAALPLPVGGLMSDRPIQEVCTNYQELLDAAVSLGSQLHDPFMAMSFMALEVIPTLKLSYRGLVNVDQMEIVDLFVD